MRNVSIGVLLPTALAMLAACGEPPASTDGGSDASMGTDSTQTMDTGTATDSGSGADTGGALDSGVLQDSGNGMRDGGGAQDSGNVGADSGMGSGDAGVTCPAAPAGASANAVAALARTNQVRLAMGSGCATMVASINQAALNHCNYYAANQSVAMCIVNAHAEVMSPMCSMFTGASFSTRMQAAGYTGSPAFECMHFVNNGTTAVQGWIDSVWHRTPVLSPWVRELGYGSATGCDTMDFGRGTPLPNNTVVMYPYPNQTNVPASFNGREGPVPPAPPAGFPSGYPITLYFRGTVTTHELRAAGNATPIAHVWITPATSNGLLSNEYVLYANTPLTARTQYNVHIVGMATGSTTPTTIDWSFTTQ